MRKRTQRKYSVRVRQVREAWRLYDAHSKEVVEEQVRKLVSSGEMVFEESRLDVDIRMIHGKGAK